MSLREELWLWKKEKVAEILANNLMKKRHEAWVVRGKEEVIEKVKEIVPEGSTVAVGGSLTLADTGVLDLLRSGKYNFLDRYSAKTREEVEEIYRKSFWADYYLTSVNALTEDGKLVFLDGNGNRVAAVVYGPKNVIVVASVNKVVRDVEEARERLRFISPMNSRRLNLETPCAKTGFCADCSSPQRICDYFLVVESGVRQPGRFKVILTLEDFGL
ncbi:lactate utilization protein [Thermotoga sp.]|uniref:lactate utilization protein n=1 Tax=Thermotoga sp. TaxID=28240 RepID=UPI0025E987BD|nr:lactate utilization protein [Thermotoga sp.]MCD6551698.1 lactate utilization protein [Thermotoga sp.]